MNVFLTGGTGFVGREILRELHEAGHHVRLLARAPNSPSAQDVAARFPVEIKEGNVLDASSLPHALLGMDAVIHLVGIISEFGEQTFANTHTRATQNVVNAALVAGVRRFLLMSALGTRVNAKSRYHQTKWAAEQAAMQSPLDWTIFRPSLIYGPRDQFVNVFARLAERSPVLPVFGDKRALFQPVAVEYVARCFVQALNEPRTVGQILDVCGPDRLTLADILRTILSVTGRKRLIFHVPNPLAEALAWAMEFVCTKFLNKAPPLNRDQLLMLREDNVGNPEWAGELFQLKPVGFAEGIARYLGARNETRGV